MGRFLIVLWNSDPKIDMIWGLYTPFDKPITDAKGIDQCMIVFGRRNAKQFSFRKLKPQENSFDTLCIYNMIKDNYTAEWERYAVELFFGDNRTSAKLYNGYYPVNVNNKYVVNGEKVDITAFTAMMAGGNYN